jgi:hypothetical protein
VTRPGPAGTVNSYPPAPCPNLPRKFRRGTPPTDMRGRPGGGPDHGRPVRCRQNLARPARWRRRCPYHPGAIHSSASGDVLELSAGTFTGSGNPDISFLGQDITVRSEGADPAGCIVDCQGSAQDQHRGFLFVSGEGPSSVLEGITITGGFHEIGGCGVQCEGASPRFLNCIFSDNHGCWYEGDAGMSCQGGSPWLEDCQFLDNSTAGKVVWEFNGDGAGLRCYESSPVLERCVFRRNVVSHLFDSCGMAAGPPATSPF